MVIKIQTNNITNNMAKEFCRDFIGTCRTKEINPYKFRSAYGIAAIMGIPDELASDFILVAEKANYMIRDDYDLPENDDFPTMFRVLEEMLY